MYNVQFAFFARNVVTANCQNMSKPVPILYVTMGLPASGKTFFSQRIATDLGIFYLNVDALRMAMMVHPTFEPQEHRTVFRTAHFIVEQHLLQGQSVVCNANYHVRNHRKELQRLADRCGATMQVIWVDVPYAVAQERIITRDHEIPTDKMKDDPLRILQRMSQQLQAPADDEPVIKINGTLPYKQQRNDFYAQLQE